MTSNILPVLVVYICRKFDDDFANKFTRFVDSYKKHKAGYDHDLLIIKKGFDKSDPEWDKLEQQISHFNYHVKECSDQYLPSGYLREILEEHPDKYVLFLTATSEFLVDNWLELYMKHANPKRVLGACGGYVSQYSHHLAKVNVPRFSLQNLLRSSRRTRKIWIDRLLGRKIPTVPPEYSEIFYYPLPGFALRTTAFLIPPGFLDNIWYWPKPEDLPYKYLDTLFESGKYNMTIQAAVAGYEIFVVGADGKAYPPLQWREAKTYLTEDLSNLIISDHRNKRHAQMRTSEQRKEMEEVIFGFSKEEIQRRLDQIMATDMSKILDFYASALAIHEKQPL